MAFSPVPPKRRPVDDTDDNIRELCREPGKSSPIDPTGASTGLADEAPRKVAVSAEPENQAPQKSAAGAYPWQAPGVSDRVRRDVLVRMHEPLKLKLDYVLDMIPGRLSMQKYIMQLVEADVAAKLKELGI